MTTPDRPRLCLLPGLDGTGRLYAPLANALADRYDVDVLAYDSTRFQDYPTLADTLSPALQRHRLAALDMPVLYLQARHDRLIWPHAGREVMRLARNARCAVIDAPHFLFQLAPLPAAAEIDRLL